MRKSSFTDDERIGINQNEIKLGKKWLLKNGVKGQIPVSLAYPLFEMFIVGYKFDEIYRNYPHYEFDQIICTAALQKWGQQKQEANKTLLDSVKAKVTKTMINQVDFLTGLLNCYAKQSEEEIRAYLSGISSEPPKSGIGTLKDYHEVIKALQTLIARSDTILDDKGSSQKGRYDKQLTRQQKEHQTSIKSTKEVEDILSGITIE